MVKEVIPIFDLDIICFRSAAAVEKRSVEVTHIGSGRTKVFNTRTEFKEFLAAADFEYVPEQYEFKDIQVAEEAKNAFHIIKQTIRGIKEDLNTDARMESFIGKGDTNFRLDLDLPVQYKSNREEQIRPILLNECKEYAIKNFPCTHVEGIEADDAVVIRSHQLKSAGQKPVIITIDKDSKGCVGTTYYDWTQPEFKLVHVPAFGYLDIEVKMKEGKKKGNKIHGSGLNFYCWQMLNGDSTDCYRPNDLHGKRFGEVNAAKLLMKAETVDELFSITERQYKEWFPVPLTYTTHSGKVVTKDYKEILELYHQCVYMKRRENDTTTFYDLWEEFK